MGQLEIVLRICSLAQSFSQEIEPCLPNLAFIQIDGSQISAGVSNVLNNLGDVLGTLIPYRVSFKDEGTEALKGTLAAVTCLGEDRRFRVFSMQLLHS